MNDRSLEETREFFAAKAATWEEKYPDDGPAFAAAIAEMALPAGGLALDAGCGTARAFPLLRKAVGAAGRVVGVDVTPEMILSARERGRGDHGRLLVADVGRLPLRDGVADGVLASGLISHVLQPVTVLSELARVTRPGGRLALFHPVGRAVLAARRGRALTAGDVRAQHNLRPLLDTAGWTLVDYHDTDERYLALARR
ncbi:MULTISPECIES: class I SAM-dependent methyltransferase [unclassified Microbispora]|uniref:class I SAM-dependent methyltransferase n=1 Tax=unclassified Microbispora TaxID=2614687 RepID=UPI001472E335|nr:MULTISPECIES: class I SAM-dependent methyltransferase [unclassified Microbispora]